MTLDMSKYLGLFVSEATEHLEALGHDLVKLERATAPGDVASMFRHAHSVKGMASSMGFEGIAQVAHRLEDLLDAVRAEPTRSSQPLVDLLLKATDHLLERVREVSEGRLPGESALLLQELAETFTTLTGATPSHTRVAPVTPVPTPVPKPAPAAPEPPRGSPQRFVVRIRIAPTCQAPGVRAFLVHKRLSLLGQLLDTKPAVEDLKAGRIPEGIIVFEVETSTGLEGVSQAMRNVAEVELLSAQAATTATPSPSNLTPENHRAGAADTGRTVRIRTELLDYFLETAGELLLATSRIRELGKTLPSLTRTHLEEEVYRLHALVKDLHGKVMSARMTPVSVITDRLPRAARDIARRRDREVDLVITGAETELDRAILEELSDPMLHILRNCIDHGIESASERIAKSKGARGRVLISVRRERDRVIVEVEDDGRGMDRQKLKAAAVSRGLLTPEVAARLSPRDTLMLACLPGVSTAEGVSDISGRGVGMDAVKRAVENVGGTLDIDSEPEHGTRFTLRLPLTVAVVNLLLVGVGDEIFGLPIAKVIGAVEADEGLLSRSRDSALLPHGTGLVPVHPLAQLLAVPGNSVVGPRPFVVVEGDGERVALAVDRLLGQEEAVLKALSRPLDLVPGLAGVTILGTGRPVFILDVPRLLA